MAEAKDFKVMGSRDFALFGVPVVAYVKPVEVDGHRAFALHGADGTPLDMLETEDMAAISAHQRNLLPVVVH